MKRACTAAFLLIAGQAWGASYDDFSRGITAVNAGESDAAIAAFTDALKAGDLAPAYVSALYRGRGRAYLQKDMCAEAVADLNTAIAQGGGNDQILYLRASAKLCSKDLAGAQKDLGSVEGGLTDPDLLFDFGQLQWKYGYFNESSESFQTGIAHIQGKHDNLPYFAIWRAMTADRGGTLDAAKLTGLATYDMSDWPGPVMKLFLGKMKPEDVAREAASKKQRAALEQKCEADFYTAEWHLARKNKDAAIPLLVAAAKSCPKNFIEYSGARAELKREAPASLPPEE